MTGAARFTLPPLIMPQRLRCGKEPESAGTGEAGRGSHLLLEQEQLVTPERCLLAPKWGCHVEKGEAKRVGVKAKTKAKGKAVQSLKRNALRAPVTSSAHAFLQLCCHHCKTSSVKDTA